MPQTIALEPLPNQTLTTVLDGQACRINVYQKSTGLYVDLYVAGLPVVIGVIARNANRIVRDAYLGFAGDLAICDVEGASDPEYSGLGSRYLLAYYSADELQ